MSRNEIKAAYNAVHTETCTAMPPPVSDSRPDSPLDPFAAARNHPGVLAPRLATPPSHIPSPFPDPFAAARNYDRTAPFAGSTDLLSIPSVDPFAAARNFVGAGVTSLGIHLPSDAAPRHYPHVQTQPVVSMQLPTATSKVERRLSDLPAEGGPPTKKAKVNNTIVRIYSLRNSPVSDIVTACRVPAGGLPQMRCCRTERTARP